MSWKFGPKAKDKNRLGSMLAAVLRLRAAGLTGSGVVGAYHTRRVVPVMARPFALFEMVPCIELVGCVVLREPIRNSEVCQRLREALEAPLPYPDPRQPAKLPEPGAIIFSAFFLSTAPLPENTAQREVNCLVTETKLKKKEDNKWKKAELQKKKGEVTKRKRQGLISSSDEAEMLNRLENEFADSSDSGSEEMEDDEPDWDELADEDDTGVEGSSSVAAKSSAPSSSWGDCVQEDTTLDSRPSAPRGRCPSPPRRGVEGSSSAVAKSSAPSSSWGDCVQEDTTLDSRPSAPRGQCPSPPRGSGRASNP
ncbi:hypothetical protein PVAP13_4KG244210 [Panicum virgatum]|uniref:Uncharacterized protein n=1 Tax=Panicum virgatum TaxID=38727 RepID=A0A8T0TMJ5_PANVG|nr:hypothetical protein PVAP13_4KG244210 [Panicum virgatum]